MPVSNSRPTARNQALKSTDTPTPTTLSNVSTPNDLSNYPHLGSGIGLSSSGWSTLECTSCLSEPNAAGRRQQPANAEDYQHLVGCIDPACTETICDECSDHEECCGGCSVDCGSDCGIHFDDNYVCENSYSELFGEQTAQTFGFGSPLPQLETDNTMTESTDYCKISDDTTLSTVPVYGMDQDHSDPILQPNLFPQIPLAFRGQLKFPQATTSDRSSCISAYHKSQVHELTPVNVLPFTHHEVSPMQSAEPSQGCSDPTDIATNAHHDHVKLIGEQTDSARPCHLPLRCQWADLNGKQCGEILSVGGDMHEHLKSAHGVKNEVFCRWVGCCVGVLTASPHRFANSVERHTWGHSGYRPYKCPACNEGFAAASVRDEHYTNIHERKKVFACDMCSHQCTSATNLKRHKDDKHSAERFQCEFCNRNGKRRLFPRGPNLARHLRTCKYVLAQFPEATAVGKTKADWLPPGYRRGHHGMDRARVTPPNYLPAQHDA